MIQVRQYSAGDQPITVHLIVTQTAGGLIVQLLGGDKPHIGATVISHPRPSLLNNGNISCNTIVIPELGHKEDELAKPLAERIAVTLNCTVVLIAGIHIDQADKNDIENIINLCWNLVELFLTSG